MNKYEKSFKSINLFSEPPITIEDLENIQELVERATPKKLVMLPNRAWKTLEESCPDCNSTFVGKFCSNCGQRLKRSD